MSKKMMGLNIYAPFDYRYEEVDVPEVGEGEILLKITGSGICASDTKTYHGGKRVLGTVSRDSVYPDTRLSADMSSSAKW